MAKKTLEPAGDYVIVIDGTETMSLDGIELPENMRQKEMLFGVVVFCGPKVDVAKPEDQVLYGPYAGKSVIMNGTQFRLLREGQIEAYVRDVQ